MSPGKFPLGWGLTESPTLVPWLGGQGTPALLSLRSRAGAAPRVRCAGMEPSRRGRGAHSLGRGDRNRSGREAGGASLGSRPPVKVPGEGTGRSPLGGRGRTGSGEGLGGPPGDIGERAEGSDPSPSAGPEEQNAGAGHCPSSIPRAGRGGAERSRCPRTDARTDTHTLSIIPVPLQLCPSPPPRCCCCCWGSSCSTSPCWCCSSSPPSLV